MLSLSAAFRVARCLIFHPNNIQVGAGDISCLMRSLVYCGYEVIIPKSVVRCEYFCERITVPNMNLVFIVNILNSCGIHDRSSIPGRDMGSSPYCPVHACSTICLMVTGDSFPGDESIAARCCLLAFILCRTEEYLEFCSHFCISLRGVALNLLSVAI
jgi:hypothetical protein